MATPGAGDELVLYSAKQRRFLSVPSAGAVGLSTTEPTAFPDLTKAAKADKALDDAREALKKAKAAVELAIAEASAFLMMPNTPQGKKAKKKVDGAKKDRDDAEKAVDAAKDALAAAKAAERDFAAVRLLLVDAGANKVALRNVAAGAFIRLVAGGKADSVAGSELNKSWKGVAFTLAASGAGLTLRADDVALSLAVNAAGAVVGAAQGDVFQAQVTGEAIAPLLGSPAPAPNPAPGPTPPASVAGVPWVISPGSAFTRFGLATETLSTAPTLVGKPKVAVSVNSQPKFGDAAEAAGASLRLTMPFVFGQVDKADDARLFLEWVARLKIAPEEHPLVITQRSGLPKASRAFYADLAFNTLNVPSLCIVDESLMALASTGLSTGVVVNIGDSVTTVASIVNGAVVTAKVQVQNFGGRDVTNRLQGLLAQRQITFTTRDEFKALVSIKETSAFVAQDIRDAESGSGDDFQRNIDLPGGRTIQVDKERFRCAEVLFDPSLAGVAGDGLPMLLLEATKYVEPRATLWSNIVLAGGGAKLKGLAARLQRECASMDSRTPAAVRCAPQDPVGDALAATETAAWLGAAAFTKDATFAARCVTRDEYRANPAIIDTRFP